jgi:hypothetical protein
MYEMLRMSSGTFNCRKKTDNNCKSATKRFPKKQIVLILNPINNRGVQE